MTANLDQYADSVCDLINGDFSESDFDEILADACDIAADEFDAETDDGEWVDSTNYQACADKAVRNWEESKYDAECERGDYLRGLQQDRDL